MVLWAGPRDRVPAPDTRTDHAGKNAGHRRTGAAAQDPARRAPGERADPFGDFGGDEAGARATQAADDPAGQRVEGFERRGQMARRPGGDHLATPGDCRPRCQADLEAVMGARLRRRRAE